MVREGQKIPFRSGVHTLALKARPVSWDHTLFESISDPVELHSCTLVEHKRWSEALNPG